VNRRLRYTQFPRGSTNAADSTTATKSRIWLSRMVITILYRADDFVI